jgi:hypothetical protein
MIAITAAVMFAFTVFSIRRGLDKQTVLGGLIAQAIGTAAMIVAAMISGFVVPAIAARYASAAPGNLTFAVQIIAICAGVNEIFARLGVIAMSLAIALWSVDLVLVRGAARIAAILGFAAGAFGVGVLLFGGHLTPPVFGAIVLGQAIWYCAVGALLIRRTL